MSIFDEQNKRFGKTCKWLDCDCDCHMTKCVLNWARREYLFETFKKMGLKHPEFAYELFSDSCNASHGENWECFNSSEKPHDDYSDIKSAEDDDYLTVLEREAIALVELEISKKDDSQVKEIYNTAKALYLKKERQRISNKSHELDEMELEQDEGQASTEKQ